MMGLIPAALGLAWFFDQAYTTPKHLAVACALGLVCFLEQGVTTPSTEKASWRAAAPPTGVAVPDASTRYALTRSSTEVV